MMPVPKRHTSKVAFWPNASLFTLAHQSNKEQAAITIEEIELKALKNEGNYECQDPHIEFHIYEQHRSENISPGFFAMESASEVFP